METFEDIRDFWRGKLCPSCGKPLDVAENNRPELIADQFSKAGNDGPTLYIVPESGSAIGTGVADCICGVSIFIRDVFSDVKRTPTSID